MACWALYRAENTRDINLAYLGKLCTSHAEELGYIDALPRIQV
jgi:hypothetical protein